MNFKLSNLKKFGNFFRLIEFGFCLIFVSRVICFQFQFPVGEFVKRLLSILFSHRFVFVIGNVIVITLFAKSGRDSYPDSHTHNESVQKVATQSVSARVTTFETELTECARVDKKGKIVNIEVMEKSKTCFKRSYSECLDVENYIKPRRILRRTVTEGCGGASSGGKCEKVEALEGCGDGMSDEEFRVMVETFIAKQQRSLREEEEKYLCVC